MSPGIQPTSEVSGSADVGLCWRHQKRSISFLSLLEECISVQICLVQRRTFSLDISSLFIGRYHLHGSDRKQQGQEVVEEEGGNFSKQVLSRYSRTRFKLLSASHQGSSDWEEVCNGWGRNV